MSARDVGLVVVLLLVAVSIICAFALAGLFLLTEPLP